MVEATTGPRAEAVLEGRSVGHVYGKGPLSARVLQPTQLALRAGEVVVMTGPSGSGKTTLLSILGLVLKPTEGEVWLEGRCVSHLPADELARTRRRALGFVFQQFNLIGAMSALENVALPLTLASVSPAEARRRAAIALERVGLGAWARRKPRELSGGQQQRVAIARAVVTEPLVVLCDEPTAALDSDSGRSVLALIRELAAGARRAVLVVTHDERVVRIADRVVHVADGQVRGAGGTADA